jgi:hypothetical protein
MDAATQTRMPITIYDSDDNPMSIHGGIYIRPIDNTPGDGIDQWPIFISCEPGADQSEINGIAIDESRANQIIRSSHTGPISIESPRAGKHIPAQIKIGARIIKAIINPITDEDDRHGSKHNGAISPRNNPARPGTSAGRAIGRNR